MPVCHRVRKRKVQVHMPRSVWDRCVQCACSFALIDVLELMRSGMLVELEAQRKENDSCCSKVGP